MTSDAQPENPTKVLSESWATLSVSDAHSEDGTRSEQTDIGSLIDQTSADDVASLDDRYSSSEIGGNDEDHDDDHRDDHDNGNNDEDEDEDESESEDSDDGNGGYDGRSSVAESQELPALYHRFGGAVEDSGLTAQAAFDHSSSESIEFVEPEKWPEMDLVELKHTFKFFGGAEASGLKEQLPDNLQDSVLMATVQQTMTKQGLDIDQPFRVLYIGNPDFRNIILDKIGDVLVSSSSSGSESSSTESSRYHVVPTSFGAGDVPNFAELLPIHVQLIVDECLEASSDPRSGKPSTLSLKFKNRAPCTSTWTGSEYCLSSPSDWTLPNVAIFFVSSQDDAAALETRHLARAFMERHGVPAMVISEKPLWTTTADLIPLNRHSLHVCLESHSRHASETVVLRRYPIDLQTFESITPGQLNRNLASLASIYPKQAHKVTTEAPKPSPWESFFDIEKYKKRILHFSNSRHTQDLALPLRLLAFTVFYMITMFLGYSTVYYSLVFLSRFFERSGVPSASSPSPSNIHTTSIIPVEGQRQTSLLVQSSPAIEVQSQGHQAEDYSHFEELMGIALSTPTQRGNSDNFELQVVGDCHVVLKPPRSFVAKKQPKFSVGVTRRESALSYELSRLFDGVYSLKLDREDAHGLVNVTISTTVSKTPLTQTIQVDFGTPWLKIANWKRAASVLSLQFAQDLSTAQTSLSRAYNRLCTDVSVVMHDAVKRSHVLRQEIDVLRHDSAQVSRETRDIVLTGTKQLSEVFRRNAVQPFWAVCSVFQQQTGKINAETKSLLSRTWSTISDISLPEVNLRETVDRVWGVRKCEALSRAQKRAQGLVRRNTCHDSGCSVQGHSR